MLFYKTETAYELASYYFEYGNIILTKLENKDDILSDNVSSNIDQLNDEDGNVLKML